MSKEIKDSWSNRAKRLNARPLIGQFNDLPEELAGLDLPSTQDLIRDCLRIDLLLLHKSIKRGIRNKNMRELYKKAVKLPYAIHVEQQLFRTATVSSLLLHTLFGGEDLSTFSFNELISSNGDPFTFHVASKKRMIDIFSVDDTCVSTLTDHQHDRKYYLTSYAILKNVDGVAIKAYGWNKTDSNIDFIFSDTGSTTKIIQFDRPFLHKKEEPPRNVLGYICDISPVDGYVLSHYSPVCIYISYKNTNNFKLLAAKLCVDNNGRVVTSKSS